MVWDHFRDEPPRINNLGPLTVLQQDAIEMAAYSFILTGYLVYSKACVKRPLKIRQNKGLNDNYGSLMKAERIAECSPWSILLYFDLH